MLHELGLIAREVREEAGVTQIRVAVVAGVDHGVISNLERGVRFPERLDEVIDAYERECWLRRGDVWRRAAALI